MNDREDFHAVMLGQVDDAVVLLEDLADVVGFGAGAVDLRMIDQFLGGLDDAPGKLLGAERRVLGADSSTGCGHWGEVAIMRMSVSITATVHVGCANFTSWGDVMGRWVGEPISGITDAWGLRL